VNSTLQKFGTPLVAAICETPNQLLKIHLETIAIAIAKFKLKLPNTRSVDLIHYSLPWRSPKVQFVLRLVRTCSTKQGIDFSHANDQLHRLLRFDTMQRNVRSELAPNKLTLQLIPDRKGAIL